MRFHPEKSAISRGASIIALITALVLLGCTADLSNADAAGRPNTEQLTDAVTAAEHQRLTTLGLAALDRFQETWNTRDVRAWSRSLHFPHVRPSAGNFSVSPTGEDYIRARAGVFESVLALGWHRSQWDSRRVLHVSANKMHIAGKYSRRRENGERISSQQVTYIVTRQGERWGIQSRFGTGKVDSGEAAAAAAEPARQAVEAYFEAFNSLDLEIWADTLHFPQVRLSSSGLDYWQTREDFFAGTEPGRQRTWFRTKLESAETVQAGADGVNVIVRYSNLNSEDETLSSYDAVYLVTRHEGRWAVQARSTYGP